MVMMQPYAYIHDIKVVYMAVQNIRLCIYIICAYIMYACTHAYLKHATLFIIYYIVVEYKYVHVHHYQLSGNKCRICYKVQTVIETVAVRIKNA